ncbi:MAG: hypothetical protein ABR875_02420 [Minisyncoccia bacterium]|jgi:hypothetical protein
MSISDWLVLVEIVVFVLTIHFLLYRSSKVFKYRGRLLDKILKIIPEDPDRALRSVKKLNSTSYSKMVFVFWKPLTSFVKEEDFV